MRLYHPSEKKFNIVRTRYFGQHYYTKNDVNASEVPRTFWYLKCPIPENRFKCSKFIYIVNVNKKRIYDLKKDKKNLKKKYRNIDKILRYLKKYYLGVLYSLPGWDMVIIFKNIKPIRIIERI